MVLAACKYVSEIILVESARRLLAQETLHPDDLLQVEDILMRRDTLETVLSLSGTLAERLIQGDWEVRQALAQAHGAAAEIDDALLARPDVVSVASRALIGLHQRIKLNLDLQRYWWFGLARNWDESLEPQLEQDLGLSAELEKEAQEEEFEPMTFHELIKAWQDASRRDKPQVSDAYAEYRVAAAAGHARGQEIQFRYYPSAENPLVTSSLETETGECLLRLQTRNKKFEGRLVWLAIQGKEELQPGTLVIPYPYPGRQEYLYAETRLEATKVRGLDHTPVRPKLLGFEGIQQNLSLDKLSLLANSALRAAQSDPDSRNVWAGFFEKLLNLPEVSEPVRLELEKIRRRGRLPPWQVPVGAGLTVV